MKRVSIKTKKTREAEMDAWVKDRQGNTSAPAEGEATDEPMKRLTIDVSESLHKRIKTYCASNGRIMADEIRSILEEKFPAS